MDRYEQSVREYVDALEDIPQQALAKARDVLTPDDRERLEGALKNLRPVFDEIDEFFIRPSNELSSIGYRGLWTLMAMAFAIGSRGVATESAKNWFRLPNRKGGEKGGKKSAETLRANAEKKWRAPASRAYSPA